MQNNIRSVGRLPPPVAVQRIVHLMKEIGRSTLCTQIRSVPNRGKKLEQGRAIDHAAKSAHCDECTETRKKELFTHRRTAE